MAVVQESTKERILQTTEKLIAEHGFDAVSLRDITSAAEVNVAAVNYHFGSKEKLYEQIQLRYILPVNEERMSRLSKLTSGGKPASVRPILEAFMLPFLTMVRESEMSERLFYKLMGRCLLTQQGDLPELLLPSLQEMSDAFVAALGDAVPSLTSNEIMLRLHFTFGSMAHTLLHSEVIKHFADSSQEEPDLNTQILWMIDFCEAGFLNAPSEGRSS